MLYKYGLSFEGILGVVFVIVGAIGYRIYKQKMRVPLIRHDGNTLIYCPSDSKPRSIRMDASARFAVSELGLTAETLTVPESRFTISRLDFDSNQDWDRFIHYLEQEPVILVHSDS